MRWTGAAGQITACLGGSVAEREAGYRELEGLGREAAGASADSRAADIAVACVAPLCAVLCRDASDVGVDEYQRATVALLGLAPLDIDRVSGEVSLFIIPILLLLL
eukprot:SAG31_NODE_19620_length_596_cov_5.668008_1_plen_105_part_10